MNFVAIKARPGLSTRRSPASRPAVQDHDLPVLAAQDNPTVTIDWEPLILTGVQPALVLGAERRWRGRR